MSATARAASLPTPVRASRQKALELERQELQCQHDALLRECAAVRARADALAVAARERDLARSQLATGTLAGRCNGRVAVTRLTATVAESSIQSLREELARVRPDATALQTERAARAELELELSRVRATRDELSVAQVRLARTVEDLEAERAQFIDDAACAQARTAAAEAAVSHLQDVLTDAEQRVVNHRAAAAALEDRLSASEQRVRDLEQVGAQQQAEFASDLAHARNAVHEMEAARNAAQQLADDARADLALAEQRHALVVKDFKRQLRQCMLSAADAAVVHDPPAGATGDAAASASSAASSILPSPRESLDSAGTDAPTVLSATAVATAAAAAAPAGGDARDACRRNIDEELRRREKTIAFLRDHAAALAQELARKSRIIQMYAARDQPSTQSRLQHAPGAGAAGKRWSPAVTEEVCMQQQHVLEDTLMRNIQLQASLDRLSREVEELRRRGAPSAAGVP